MYMASLEEFRVEHLSTGEVGEKHTECDRKQQQGLVLLLDGEVEQEASECQHNKALPATGLNEHHVDTRSFEELGDALAYK